MPVPESYVEKQKARWGAIERGIREGGGPVLNPPPEPTVEEPSFPSRPGGREPSVGRERGGRPVEEPKEPPTPDELPPVSTTVDEDITERIVEQPSQIDVEVKGPTAEHIAVSPTEGPPEIPTDVEKEREEKGIGVDVSYKETSGKNYIRFEPEKGNPFEIPVNKVQEVYQKLKDKYTSPDKTLSKAEYQQLAIMSETSLKPYSEYKAWEESHEEVSPTELMGGAGLSRYTSEQLKPEVQLVEEVAKGRRARTTAFEEGLIEKNKLSLEERLDIAEEEDISYTKTPEYEYRLKKPRRTLTDKEEELVKRAGFDISGMDKGPSWMLWEWGEETFKEGSLGQKTTEFWSTMLGTAIEPYRGVVSFIPGKQLGEAQKRISYRTLPDVEELTIGQKTAMYGGAGVVTFGEMYLAGAGAGAVTKGITSGARAGAEAVSSAIPISVPQSITTGVSSITEAIVSHPVASQTVLRGTVYAPIGVKKGIQVVSGQPIEEAIGEATVEVAGVEGFFKGFGYGYEKAPTVKYRKQFYPESRGAFTFERGKTVIPVTGPETGKEFVPVGPTKEAGSLMYTRARRGGFMTSREARGFKLWRPKKVSEPFFVPKKQWQQYQTIIDVSPGSIVGRIKSKGGVLDFFSIGKYKRIPFSEWTKEVVGIRGKVPGKPLMQGLRISQYKTPVIGGGPPATIETKPVIPKISELGEGAPWTIRTPTPSRLSTIGGVTSVSAQPYKERAVRPTVIPETYKGIETIPTVITRESIKEREITKPITEQLAKEKERKITKPAIEYRLENITAQITAPLMKTKPIEEEKIETVPLQTIKTIEKVPPKTITTLQYPPPSPPYISFIPIPEGKKKKKEKARKKEELEKVHRRRVFEIASLFKELSKKAKKKKKESRSGVFGGESLTESLKKEEKKPKKKKSKKRKPLTEVLSEESILGGD